MKSKELKRHICLFNDGNQGCKCFEKGQKAERRAWLRSERCHSCGKPITPQGCNNTCDKCWEEQ